MTRTTTMMRVMTTTAAMTMVDSRPAKERRRDSAMPLNRKPGRGSATAATRVTAVTSPRVPAATLPTLRRRPKPGRRRLNPLRRRVSATPLNRKQGLGSAAAVIRETAVRWPPALAATRPIPTPPLLSPNRRLPVSETPSNLKPALGNAAVATLATEAMSPLVLAAIPRIRMRLRTPLPPPLPPV